jgi:hypothetical protein
MLPHLFLKLAEELAKVDGPAECRTIISRAYYAVYNVAERFLERMSFQRPKRDYHIVLQRRLQNSGDLELVQLGSNLGDLHHERIRADYHMDDHVPENKNNAVAAARKAATMIVVLDGCPVNGERWKSIRAAIARANVTGTDSLIDLSSS